jgi:hypothetical protein
MPVNRHVTKVAGRSAIRAGTYLVLSLDGLRRIYESRYGVPTMPAGAPSGEAAGMSQPSMSLFVVERRLPKITEHQLEVLQAALSGAASRFQARGDGVRYLSSIYLSRTGRLLSLFIADSAETVRAVNEAALIPFASIEPAIELPNTGR